MCGIAGYINIDLKPVNDTAAILKMMKAQNHRGPDDSGLRLFSMQNGNSREASVLAAEQIEGRYEGVLGFNRLSILDLSHNGHQPMCSPDNKVFLTLNGEIYNAFDFMDELDRWGYEFKSTTDTEIVLALYLKYGIEGLLARLNGMFAISIVDLSKHELFLARDRFGIKPLYYIHNTKILAFSSELKSFRFLDDFSYTLNSEKLDEYLLFRSNLTGTLFREIEPLEPGYYIVFSPGRGLNKHQFFDKNSYSRSANNGSIEERAKELEGWLGKSVKSQLISDVKLGCQLSGGIDSSLVTWLANAVVEKGNLASVSIVFNNQHYTEEQYIDHVTKVLGITSHKFLLDQNYYLDNIEDATWHLELPLNHPNTVGIYKLSQEAKKYVTVLLSGEGADEIFGGYKRLYDLKYPFNLAKLMHEARVNFRDPYALIRYLRHDQRAVMSSAYLLPRIASHLKSDFNLNNAIDERLSLYNSLSGSTFDRQLKYELYSNLPDLMIRQDKMSMAHSIENRVPFLDNEVVENSFTIPEGLLLLEKSAGRNNPGKYLLKRLAANVFGNEFAIRDKMGFGIPLKEFLGSTGFREYMNDKLLPGIKKRELFNHDIVTGWANNTTNLRYTEIEALWIMIAFEIWASIYLDSGYENRYS